MKKKISSILLASLIPCLAVFGACNGCGGTGDSSSSSDSASEVEKVVETLEATDGAQHLVDASKLLHKKTVTEVGRPFIVGQATDYVIVLGTNSASAIEAANFLASQIEQATGAYVHVYIDADQDMQADDDIAGKSLAYSAQSKYIVYSHEKMEEAANIVWEKDEQFFLAWEL